MKKKNDLIYEFKNYLNGLNDTLPSELLIAIVCEKMHWTYDEFLDQPDWFCKTLLLKWNEESIYQKQQIEKNAK